ncbi:MAG TPA: protein kinase [Thermoanaerobaculia bacterium]|nr:protein kinase [Thermoanaerobaculia bacterium]
MLSSGDRLGHYQILGPLGAGGMGEVYRARDERLGRDVAIKILPEFVRSDRHALARFEREARAVAALSHRNVISIFHFEVESEFPYFVMELLEGETLSSRIAKRTSWRDAAGIGSQIAEALAAAHDRGVIHRDLKPANIFVLRDGTVKVLDFGLARLTETGGDEGDASTAVHTAHGVVVGTHGYMSPEQLAGDAVDHRTDIFSLGCVLHEMLTGISPFRRQTAAATAAAVLHEEPGELPSDTPPELQKVVARCLRKNREQRFQSARDAAIELRDIDAPHARLRPRRRIAWIAAAAVAVIAAVAAAVVTFVSRDRDAATPSSIGALLVLPFESAGSSPETEFVADGVTEGLINGLARLPNTRVVARTTSFSYKGKPIDLKSIHRDLDVDAVLTGRVTSQPSVYRVQADLIDVRSGTQLWGERYQTTEMTGIERKIAADVASRLRGDLSPAQLDRLRTAGTSNDEAYLLYLKGRREWYRRENETLTGARDLFQQAIDRDPSYADAYAGLADTYALFGGMFRPVGGEPLSKEEALSRGEAAARRALAIDPDHAEAHASLGLIAANRFHFRAAERHLQRAIALNPSYPSARSWYWLVLQAAERWDEALREIKVIQNIDPLWARGNFALALYLTGDVDGALRESRRNLIQDENFWNGHWIIGMVHERQGRYQEAAESYRKGLGRGPFFEALVARIDAKTGDAAKARKVAKELEEDWKRGQQPPTPIAYIYSALREYDTAFQWLDRALESRDVLLRNQLHTIGLSELRGDPRFADLKRRMFEIEAADERLASTSPR